MQISSANLLATQSQVQARSRAPSPAFEPMAFKEAPAASVTQSAAPASSSPSAASASTAPNYSGGYVRPGSNLDIKI
jgi:hypothetical protein